MGKVGSVIRWMCRVEEPEAENNAVGVAAREKISVIWALEWVSYGYFEDISECGDG
jgi:hypothetical protein